MDCSTHLVQNFSTFARIRAPHVICMCFVPFQSRHLQRLCSWIVELIATQQEERGESH
jgi:hypothetical protein